MTGYDPFARQMNPQNYLDRLQAIQRNQVAMALQLAGRQGDGPRRELVDRSPNYTMRYSIDISFSDDDGESFTENVEVVGARLFLVRCTITQHTSEPQVSGFELEWPKSTHWNWADGLGLTTWEEAVSNPLEVTRVVRSPADVRTVGRNFAVIVREEFPVW